ncbi:hypothetical protein Taro_002879 [Colocasia esculenta]|uniref:RNase H type-1 domain-containing protein n=1 Tax=Colocasia esculenta TaxID=4460 RepID=A0A843TMA0_COLES|nr:hypothetical protein [Colocasia esculenta]
MQTISTIKRQHERDGQECRIQNATSPAVAITDREPWGTVGPNYRPRELVTLLWHWVSPLIHDNAMGPHITYATNVAVQWVIFKKESTSNQLTILQHFGFKSTIKLKVPKLVRWTPPQYGFSLNVDGACKGNPSPCGGGGCIRDSNGDIHLGFTFYYGRDYNMLAEVRALCDGLRLADYHGLPISIVHFDSLALVHSINSNMCPSWKCIWWWRIARSFLCKTNIKLVHAYRETNRVADALASCYLEFMCLTLSFSFIRNFFNTYLFKYILFEKSLSLPFNLRFLLYIFFFMWKDVYLRSFLS